MRTADAPPQAAGKDRKRFGQVLADLEMPENRQEECAGEYSKIHDSWFGLLNQKMRKDEKASGFQISYKPPDNNNLSGYADLVKASSLLEIVEKVANTYALDDSIKLTAAECGDSNAYWSGGDRELTYCYQLTQWYTQSKASTYQGEEEEQGATESSGLRQPGGLRQRQGLRQ